MINIILKIITYIAFLLFWLSMDCMDSENIVLPMIVMFISLAWLAFAAKANGYMK